MCVFWVFVYKCCVYVHVGRGWGVFLSVCIYDYIHAYLSFSLRVPDSSDPYLHHPQQACKSLGYSCLHVSLSHTS